MQSRRDFLKTLGALGALAAFPNLLSPPIQSPPQFLGLVQYSLGFQISQEMVEDDMYGPGGILGKTVERMAKAMPTLIEQDLLAKHALISLSYD